MPAATTQNSTDPTRSSANHYLVTPSPAGGWSVFEVLPGGEQDAAEFTAGTTDVLKFRKFGDAAEMCQRLNAYYLPSSPPAVAAGQRVG
ncbi:MAG: hypothetical protein MUF18_19300 [Fimbriiglobus sp.]|nr:hypothetical protein [Fimbriiglobus sp.]